MGGQRQMTLGKKWASIEPTHAHTNVTAEVEGLGRIVTLGTSYPPPPTYPTYDTQLGYLRQISSTRPPLVERGAWATCQDSPTPHSAGKDGGYTFY